MLIRAVYMSRPSAALQAEGFETGVTRIVTQSQRRNRNHGITGALLTHENWFIQILEGDRTSLMPVLLDILGDERHENVRLFEIIRVQERLFTQWSMHAGRLSELEPRMVWECIDAFNRYGPMRANILIQALSTSVMLSAA